MLLLIHHAYQNDPVTINKKEQSTQIKVTERLDGLDFENEINLILVKD